MNGSTFKYVLGGLCLLRPGDTAPVGSDTNPSPGPLSSRWAQGASLYEERPTSDRLELLEPRAPQELGCEWSVFKPCSLAATSTGQQH